MSDIGGLCVLNRDTVERESDPTRSCGVGSVATPLFTIATPSRDDGCQVAVG